jgi:peptide-methionine (S)-S-oxide reductase
MLVILLEEKTLIAAVRIITLMINRSQRPMKINDPIFQDAVAAIDAGDVAQLALLIRNNPRILTRRLDEPTEGYFKNPYLLWFVAENPTRNETLPKNIIEVTQFIINVLKDIKDVSYTQQVDYTLGLVCSGSVARRCGVQEGLIDLLVRSGADPNHAVTAAVTHGEVAAVERLIHHGATITLIMAISTERKNEIISILPNCSQKELQEGLAVAALYGQADTIALLIQRGVDVKAFNPEGFHSHSTALHQAAWSGSLQAVKLLAEAGGDLRVRDKTYFSHPLGWAIHSGHLEVARYIRETLAARAAQELVRQGCVTSDRFSKAAEILARELDF